MLFRKNAKNKLFVALFSILIITLLLQGCKNTEINSIEQHRDGNKLIIPPLLEDQNPNPDIVEYQLFVKEGESEFFTGIMTNSLGYNGNYLGPVLRIRRNQQVDVTVTNQMKEMTTVHWHGMEVSGEDDGGPHLPIQPGNEWKPSFVVDQPAATLWYHPHPHANTGPQVYYGLAGLIYIEDEVSDSLNIPKNYGVNDIPLIVQDRNFNNDGSFLYDLNMMGLAPGNTILVNGTVDPYVEVTREQIRLRILNGSNFENFRFNLDNGSRFFQIASDGGFLESPVERDSLFMTPGERIEVIVDFSTVQAEQVILMAGNRSILTFYLNGSPGDNKEIPQQLTTIQDIPLGANPNTRLFVLQGMGINGTINGKSYDMDRIDEEVKLNETELWVIRNQGGMMMNTGGHSFHVHATQFQIVSRNGNPPPPYEMGLKDTIFVEVGEEVVIKVRFEYEGIFMYHCHLLEHEDYGMMGQFRVQ